MQDERPTSEDTTLGMVEGDRLISYLFLMFVQFSLLIFFSCVATDMVK